MERNRPPQWQPNRHYLLNRIAFDYRGCHFRGTGTLKYFPDDGFLIEGEVKARPGEKFKPVPFGGVRVEGRSDAVNIRLSVSDVGRAILPKAFLVSQNHWLRHGRISLLHPTALFIEERYEPLESDDWQGSATLLTDENIVMWDSLTKTTELNKKLVTTQIESGFSHADDSLWIRAYHRERGRLELDWAPPKAKWTRRQCWLFAEAFQDALSLVSLRRVRLLDRSCTRRKIIYREQHLIRAVRYLRWFVSPFPQSITFAKEAFLAQLLFYLHNTVEAKVCRHMFSRLLLVSRGEHPQDVIELLLATIREAALRTLENRPFAPRDRSWRLDDAVERFRKRYFVSGWEPECRRAIEATKRLRHRNAHPDWVEVAGGTANRPDLAGALNDMIYLSRFYGYMILALSRRKGFTAAFPKPYEQWGEGNNEAE